MFPQKQFRQSPRALSSIGRNWRSHTDGRSRSYVAPRTDLLRTRNFAFSSHVQSNTSLTAPTASDELQAEVGAKADESFALGLLVEFVSRIEHSEDAVRSSRIPHRSDAPSALAQFIGQRALKDIASDLCRSYMSLDPISLRETKYAESRGEGKSGGGREAVLQYLTTKCGTDDGSVEKAMKSYQEKVLSGGDTKEISRLSLTKRLRDACTPKYLGIFNKILSEAQRDLGMAFLIQLRYDVRLSLSNIERGESIEPLGVQSNGGEGIDSGVSKPLCIARMRQMDSDLKGMLSSLFSQPILELRRISYDTTPASIIEKVAKKEAVHPLRSLDDLRIRLGPNRRCFAFFHPSIPDEPLVFVHVALLPFMPETMEDIDEAEVDNDMHNRTRPKTAVFYSITNTQPGLSGVDLGNFLIKRVVEEVRSEFPGIETFCTLSPIPRFRKWVRGKLFQNQEKSNEAGSKFVDDGILSDHERQALMDLLKCPSIDTVPRALQAILDTPWHRDEELSKGLHPILMRLAAQYLVHEKHRGRPLDGVAKFHIRNGAEMHRLNYLADKSRKGMHNSAGIMINYRYVLDSIEENNVAYEANGCIPVREGVTKWLA